MVPWVILLLLIGSHVLHGKKLVPQSAASKAANDPVRDGYPECDGRVLILSPAVAMGLHNQVDLLVHAIYAGIITNRNVCIWGFRTTFTDEDSINIGFVYNLHAINYGIRNSGILSRIRPEDQTINRNPTESIFVAPVSGEVLQYMDEVPCYELRGEGAQGSRRCKHLLHTDKYFGITRDIREMEKNYQGIIQFLQRGDVQAVEKLALTSGLPFDRKGFETTHDDEIINEIHLLIKFAPAYYEVSKAIQFKNGIVNNTPYTAVHFRLEDDALSQYFVFNWYEYEEIPSVKEANLQFNYTREEHDVFVASKFAKTIVQTVAQSEKLFMCGGLHKYKNRLNFLLELLDNHYGKNMIAADLISPASSDYHELPIHGRESAAIIDYIISLEATSFIGISASTFSANTMRHVKRRHGISDLYYGKGETRLHERTHPHHKHRQSKILSRATEKGEMDHILKFTNRTFMFSIRDMGLPAFAPTDLPELNDTLSVPGLVSGIKLVNMYRKNNPPDPKRGIGPPPFTYLPSNKDGMLPEQ